MTHLIKFLESKAVDMQKNIDKASLRQRCQQHSCKRRKLLECGRTGKVVWKLDGLSNVFDNGRVFSSRKHSYKAINENCLCQFCSPLLYTNPHGYLRYLRLIPYGCYIGEGNSSQFI